MIGSVIETHRATFRAIARTVVPETDSLDEAGWREVEGTAEHAVAQRPQRMQRQLRMLLRMVEQLPRMTAGCSFSALDPKRRARLLEKLQRSPVKLIRRGIWGVRTLVLMGYYTRPETMRDVGYRADPRGWAARRPEP